MVCVHAITYQDETGKRRGLRTPQSYIQEKGEAFVADDEVSLGGFIFSQCSDVKSDGSGNYEEVCEGGDDGDFGDKEDVYDEGV